MRTTLAIFPPNFTAEKAEVAVPKYLAFRLAKHDFAMETSVLREIMGMQEIQPVPDAPDYVKGILNVRGKATPVIDLRIKLGLPQAPFTYRTCIVLVEVEGERGRLVIGGILDGVSEVLTIPASMIEAFEDRSAHPPHEVAMAKLKGKTKTVIDLSRVFSSEEISDIEGLIG